MCKQTLKKMQKREFILYTNRKTFMSIIAMTDRPKDKMNHILDDHWIKESKRKIWDIYLKYQPRIALIPPKFFSRQTDGHFEYHFNCFFI